MAAKWTAFPHRSKPYAYGAAALEKHWSRLHRGDLEPWPADTEAREAWRAFHAGDFERAVEAGRDGNPAGRRAAVKAQVVYANALAPEKARLALLEEAGDWAEQIRSSDPSVANSHYLLAFALGRYSQQLSVAKALARGLGGKVKDALTRCLELAPSHAEAHTAFGAFEAEVIDKVGAIAAGVSYGARRDSALRHFQEAVALHPESPIARIEYANGLLLLFGKARIAEAEALYGEAAACKPMDAMEKLDVEFARAELA